jgi:hypothetical protein
VYQPVVHIYIDQNASANHNAIDAVPTARQKAGETDIFKLVSTDICMGTVKLSSLSRPRATVVRLHANKAKLLMVLERLEIPLHTNGFENDIRCQVTRREVSARTRSDLGRDCRNAFLGLARAHERYGVLS